MHDAAKIGFVVVWGFVLLVGASLLFIGGFLERPHLVRQGWTWIGMWAVLDLVGILAVVISQLT